ncbi:MAG: helix-turn-helix transcriptional regulator [Flavobacterium sp.]|nr:helix-turn-helix transcriptional regulator [Flavobacterium sp.]
MNEKKINQFISHQLVKAREELGLTQKQVEESGIIKQSNLSKFENGLSTIDASKLMILASYYHKPISFFFKDEK